ncbi:TPA: acetaldehyde dehydrogenase, partial [Streptococcus pyogenes]|nr:acetaldehyde dehydrogenase [Streptococcus pyogenes]
MTEGHNTVETTSVSVTINALVQKGLAALEEMRKLDQEQVDYIVAKASVAALDAHGE